MYMSKDTVASSAGTPAASIPPPRSSQQCWHTAPLYQFTSVMGWTKPGREGKWKQNNSEDVRESLPETKASPGSPQVPNWSAQEWKRMQRMRGMGGEGHEENEQDEEKVEDQDDNSDDHEWWK